MKKCPNCQKEFPDSMRFCQTDGTPLLEAVEEIPADDPLKTTVVRQEDFASAIPPSDPFKTMVASSISEKDEDDDVLQLPEEFDPLKTMVAPSSTGQDKPILENLEPETPKFEAIKQEIQSETPPLSPFEKVSEPSSFQADQPISSPFSQPEPPKFNEPVVNPPDFSAREEKIEDDLPATVFQNPFEAGNFPPSEPAPYSSDPVVKPNNAPLPTPFDKPAEKFDPTPFNDPGPQFGGGQQTPFSDPAKPLDAKQSPFQSTPFESPKPAFQEPSVPFGSPQKPFSPMQDQGSNQPLQESGWNPPPAPVAGWQDQGLGANTPFQPPVSAGQNQTLAIVSLVCGGIALLGLVGLIIPFVNILCMISSIGLGLGAIITGFLGRSKANNDPAQYGGAGLALGGIITGGLAILVIVGLFVLAIAFGLLTNLR